MLLKPRNETEFIRELKEWFIKGNSRAYFERIVSASGRPDLLFGMIHDGQDVKFYAEAKYVHAMPRTLLAVWKLLRANQQTTFLKMASSGFKIYIIVCILGIESCWYLIDPDMALDALVGNRAPETAIYLKHVANRSKDGKWQLANAESAKGFGKIQSN